MKSGNRKTAVVQYATKALVNYEKAERERLAPEIARLQSARKTMEAIIEKQRKSLKDVEETGTRNIAEMEANLPVVPQPPIFFTSDVTAEKLETLLEANEGRLAIISDEGGNF